MKGDQPTRSVAGAQRGFASVVIGDGRPLILAVAGALVFAGGFAIFLAATGQFLPHDTQYLGMTADELCQVEDCRIVEFMIHDRAAFGGTLVGIGTLYVWLVAFPLSAGQRWAWWTLAVSAAAGFGSFAGYLGSGYFDSWHAIGTLLMLPIFVAGMMRTRQLVGDPESWTVLVRWRNWLPIRDRRVLGRLVLIGGAVATFGGGLAVLRVGVGDTFVPEDLEFMGLNAATLEAINPRLVPLLAHDRIGFGGGVLTMGLTTALCLWHGELSRHLHQAVAAAGGASLTAALGVHFAVGYTDTWHLLPAAVAAACLIIGLALQHPGAEPANPPAAHSQS